MTHPVTVLWSVPRTVSTSFERMVSARGDHTVFDEPFSQAYYYGPERVSDRYDNDLPDSSAEQVLAAIGRAAEERPVFVKDMAYQAEPYLSAGALGDFRNSFLVREPASTLRSLHGHWPDFTDAETGWEALDRAADAVALAGQPLVVVDAARLCRDPARVVSAWCDAMGLDFREDALTWEAGMRPEWELWGEWHASTAASTGFGELGDAADPPTADEPRLLAAYERAQPVYERLAALAL